MSKYFYDHRDTESQGRGVTEILRSNLPDYDPGQGFFFSPNVEFRYLQRVQGSLVHRIRMKKWECFSIISHSGWGPNKLLSVTYPFSSLV